VCVYQAVKTAAFKNVTQYSLVYHVCGSDDGRCIMSEMWVQLTEDKMATDLHSHRRKNKKHHVIKHSLKSQLEILIFPVYRYNLHR